MKNILTITIICCAVLFSNAQTFDQNGITYEIIDSSNLEVGVLAGCQPVVNIPNQVNYNSQNYTVVNILDSAFNSCSSLTTLSLPDTLEYIGLFAFNNNSNLTDLTIPDSVTFIGQGAFTNCQALTTVALPSGLTEINEDTFWNCVNLANVTIPDSVTEIGKEAFKNNNALINLTLPSALTEIKEQAFAGCEQLQNLTFPGTLQTIGSSAFLGCEAFTEVNLPNSVTTLGTGVFALCFGITDIVNFPNTITQIPEFSFNGCIGLINVSIPSQITTIGESAFRTCESLSSIAIPDTVTTIEDNAFYQCYDLQQIDLPASLSEISNSLFFNSGLTSISIPQSVTSIGISAFASCSDLESVDIPNSVNSIDVFAFSNTNINTAFVAWNSPITIDANVFNSVNLNSATLVVPSSTEAVYGAEAVWQDFGNITSNYGVPVSIPDVNFEQALIDANIDSDGIINGQMFEADAQGVTTLSLNNLSISDLSGIEIFTDIETLSVADNNLTDLDLSINENLFNLDCQNNQLESLNVKNGNNSNFVTFNALNNPNLECITVDDVTYSQANWTNVDSSIVFSEDCSSTFNIPDSNFEQTLVSFGFDSDGTVNGEMLVIDAIGVTSLSLSSDNISDLTGIEAFINLETLSAFNNNISSIDLSQNTALINVSLSGNNLNEIDVSNNLNLESLSVSFNNIVDLDVSQNPNLDTLFCSDNQLESLNVQNGNNINFTNLEADNNPNLDCIEVDDVNFSQNNWPGDSSFQFDPQITFSIDCSAVASINIPDPNFEQALIDDGIDSDGIINGQMIETDALGVVDLDVSSQNISDLTGIEFFTDLEVLFAFDNNISTINLSQNAQLNAVLLSTNNLNSIDLSNNPNLSSLALNNNNLSNLDLSSNAALTQIFVNNNNLSSIDVSMLSNLSNFEVTENNLTALDVSQNPNLITLFCSDNQLQSLNVQNGNNTNFDNFEAQNNPNLNCVQVDDIAFANANWLNQTAGFLFDPQVFFSENCNGLVNIPDPNFEQALLDANIDTDGILNGLMSPSNTVGVTLLNLNSLNISDLTGIEAFTDLETLFALDNNLTNIDVSNNTALLGLVLDLNNLTSIDVTNNVNLVSLGLSQNQITTLDLTNNSSITQVFVQDNLLTEFDATILPNLAQLDVSQNDLTLLDLSQNPDLDTLIASDNNLISLNLQNGNNANVASNAFDVTSNQYLTCIQVDDVNYSNSTWSLIDTQSFFSIDCEPENDDCLDADFMFLGQDTFGSTFSSSPSGVNPNCQQVGLIFFDVWFEFTVPASGEIEISVVPENIDFLGKAALYNNCNDTSPIACGSDILQVDNLIPGETYHIQVWLESGLGGLLAQNSNTVAGNFTINVEDSTLSTQDFNPVLNINVYPNPASQFINLDSSDMMTSFQIFDLNGRTVLTEESLNTLTQQIDISALSQGTYLLKVDAGKASSTQKLIIK